MPADPNQEDCFEKLHLQKAPSEADITIRKVLKNDEIGEGVEEEEEDEEEDDEEDDDNDDIDYDGNKKETDFRYHKEDGDDNNRKLNQFADSDCAIANVSTKTNEMKDSKCLSGVKEIRDRDRDEVTAAQRVFKKSAPNNKMTLYLSSRDLVVGEGKIDRLIGLLHLHDGYQVDGKIYGQITLTFRYGREDEEVMGLKFCNEAVMCLAQLYPPHPAAQTPAEITPLQLALSKRLPGIVVPFNMEITPLAPPSVQLVPAKEYNGAPIGTSYDIRTYVEYYVSHAADKLEEKLQKRTTIKMGIRVVQRPTAPPSPSTLNPTMQLSSPSSRRYAHRRKTPLFGSKSAPLDAKICQTPTHPVGRVLSPTQSLDRLASHRKNSSVLWTETTNAAIERKLSLRTPSHVSFKTQVDTTEISDRRLSIPQVRVVTPTWSLTNDDNKQENEEPSSSSSPPPPPPPLPLSYCCGGKRPSLAIFLTQVSAPQAIVEKPFLLSDGLIQLEASLNKGVYSHGEQVQVSVQIRNFSSKTVKRIKVFVVQYVDVCMFSNGKFKNVVASINSKEDCPVGPNSLLTKTYILLPEKGVTKNWIALEDSYTKSGTSLASTVTPVNENPEERNVFAIYVTYYVKVKLLISLMGGQVSLKLPFTLMHTCSEFDPTWSKDIESPANECAAAGLQNTTTPEEIKPEKDGT